MPTRVRSHAKINLGLGIGAPRPDGFHELTTVYQTVELHDVVAVSAREAAETRIRLTSNDERVPTDARNTAWRMVEAALRGLRLSAEVEIHIEKRLPVQGGLGAGSANAVAALVGLERELGIGNEGQGTGDKNVRTRPREVEGGGPSTAGATASCGQHEKPEHWAARRLEIAAQVGSDVPLFLIGGTVLGLDRGQEVYPLPDIEPVWCVVAAPAVGVSTPQAFRDWDAHCAAAGLTMEASADKLNRLSRAYASAFGGGIPRDRPEASSSGVLAHNHIRGEDLAGPQESALVRTGITSWIQNDFEQVVFRQHPSLADIKRLLAGGPNAEAAQADSCLFASLSGSGSALFGLYMSRRDAEAACDRLQRAGIRVYLTRTLGREQYWRDMVQED